MEENEAIDIRQSGNPGRTFCRDTKYSDLQDKTYQEIVEYFNLKISGWYFDIAESLETKESISYNFALTILCCVILDSLSQYVAGIPSSDKDAFKDFFRQYFPKLNTKIQPPIKSCYYRKGTWIEEMINDTADGVYHCFRCGVVHSARILEYGRINKLNQKAIRITDWGDNKKEITVNPDVLIKEIRLVFNNYIKKLKNNNKTLKNNFIKKMRYEYGIEIRKSRTGSGVFRRRRIRLRRKAGPGPRID